MEFYSFRALAHCAKRPLAWTWFFVGTLVFPIPFFNFLWLGAAIAEAARAMEQNRRPRVRKLFTLNGVGTMFMYGLMQSIGALLCGVGLIVAWYRLWFTPEAGGYYNTSWRESWEVSKRLRQRHAFLPIWYIIQATLTLVVVDGVLGLLVSLMTGATGFGAGVAGETGGQVIALLFTPLLVLLVLASAWATMAITLGGYAQIHVAIREDYETALSDMGCFNPDREVETRAGAWPFIVLFVLIMGTAGTAGFLFQTGRANALLEQAQSAAEGVRSRLPVDFSDVNAPDGAEPIFGQDVIEVDPTILEERRKGLGLSPADEPMPAGEVEPSGAPGSGIWRYEDGEGTLHVTDDYASIPRAYRAGAKKI